MRKLYVGLIMSVMACSLCACGKNETTNQKITEQTSEMQETTVATEEENSSENEAEANTPATILLADFKEKMDAGELATAQDMANALIGNEVIPFMGATMQVEPGFLNGFTEEINGFTEGATFGPSIGSIPFVGYIFKVDGDVDAFVQNLKDKADLRWNICTQADEMVCEASGDTVFFVMSPMTFEE